MNSSPIEICPEDVQSMIGSADLCLIDCREPPEFEIAKIEGAVLFPMSQIAARTQELAEFADKQLVVYCHHGMRSLRVANFLRENGFPAAQSMSGGIDAWSLTIDASVPRY